MKIYRIFFVLFISSLHILSQDSHLKTNSLSVSIGLSDFHVRDEIASPLTYGNRTLRLGIEYNAKKDLYRHIIELDGYYGLIYIRFPKYETENIRGSLRYSYLHLIHRAKLFSSPLVFYIGGCIHTFLNHSSYREYITTSGIIEAPWYWSHSLGLSLLTHYQFKENEFTIHCNYSILSNVSRPAYSYVPGTQTSEPIKPLGKMEMFWNHQKFRAKLEYIHRLGKLWNISASYNFEYLCYPNPRKIALYMNNVYFGVTIKF